MNILTIEQAAQIIRAGGVVVYPTESCYGFGCDPKNNSAVRRILKIKGRHKDKGLILVTDHLYRVRRFISYIPKENQKIIFQSWPGPTTWLLPASGVVSNWVKGSHSSLAIRVSKHTTIRKLCQAANMSLISTSANKSAQKALRRISDIKRIFGSEIEGIVMGRIGNLQQPTTIRDGLTCATIRA